MRRRPTTAVRTGEVLKTRFEGTNGNCGTVGGSLKAIVRSWSEIAESIDSTADREPATKN
jgi:hypothetical protein